MSFWQRVLDLIFPVEERCFNCGSYYKSSELKGICLDCLAGMSFIENYCQYCGRALIGKNVGEDKNYCERCSKQDLSFDYARSITLYKGVIRTLLIKFKYYQETSLSKPLGQLLAMYYQYYYGKEKIDYLIPIPLHKKRFTERGYNQVELLADELAYETGLPVLKNVMLRKIATKPLYNLSAIERSEVIRGCFTLDTNTKLSSKGILLLDDIMTTRTTVNEAARVLKNEGDSGPVYVLTLASGQ
ncbi:MAG: ComF family protein [Firmicutes bacterium]|nr:ComF family protein [Bacillota bacterium]